MGNHLFRFTCLLGSSRYPSFGSGFLVVSPQNLKQTVANSNKKTSHLPPQKGFWGAGTSSGAPGSLLVFPVTEKRHGSSRRRKRKERCTERCTEQSSRRPTTCWTTWPWSWPPSSASPAPPSLASTRTGSLAAVSGGRPFWEVGATCLGGV